jgi:hypothetical protein
MIEVRVVPYVLRWRPHSAVPGAHVSAREGSGGDFRRHTTLLRHPDPRRIDLRQTFRDPMADVHVRQFAQRSSVKLMTLVDLSGSMNFDARMQVAADFCKVMAASAHEAGDSFGLIGCDAHVRDDVYLAPSRRRGLAQRVHALLTGATAGGAVGNGLIEAARRVPNERCLVFLISDFLMPLDVVEAALALLWRHDVVPVRLCESTTEPPWPTRGVIQLRDLETGRLRLVVLRPAVIEAWRAAQREHDQRLEQLFNEHGRVPLRLFDRLDLDRLARYWAAR